MASQNEINAGSQVNSLNELASRPGKRKLWTLTILIGLVIIGGYLYFNSGSEAQSDQPLIATVSIDSIENTISSAGTLKPHSYVDVGAQVSGLLETLYVEIGDIVEAGQLLAEIDARTQVSRVEASRAAIEAQLAQVASREALLALAETNAKRQERLKAADATSELEYDNAISNLASAEASLTQLQKQIDQARASLASEETQLEFTRIYAPIDGTVVSIEMNEGRTLNANQQAPTILRIADLSTMTIEAEISEADIGNLSKGMSIYFTTLSGGSRRWRGELRQILPTPVIENNVVLYTGLFDVDNSDGTLLPEMTAQVFFITSAARNVLTVPIAALSFIDKDQSNEPSTETLETAPQQRLAARPAAPDSSLQRQRGNRQNQTGRRPDRVREPQQSSSNEAAAPRFAMVTIINADGSRQQKQVEIGVTSRISAEVIAGLDEGEQVIAGIVQTSATQSAGNAQARSGIGGFGGGFR